MVTAKIARTPVLAAVSPKRARGAWQVSGRVGARVGARVGVRVGVGGWG